MSYFGDVLRRLHACIFAFHFLKTLVEAHTNDEQRLPACESLCHCAPVSQFAHIGWMDVERDGVHLFYMCVRAHPCCLCVRVCSRERSARFISKPNSWLSANNE